MSIAVGKKNLSQICKILAQITSGLEFGDDEPSYVPINDFMRNAIQQMSTWFLEGIVHLSVLFGGLKINISCKSS
jgi:Ras GTPase-activating-like protein IQGAP2/3